MTIENRAPFVRLSDRATPDADAATWVNHLPARLRPYARLARVDRPIGTWLLFWPCAWGVALAGGLPNELYLLPLFLVGAVAMRSAGCVYNDMVDRKLDASVARTRDRPIASGVIAMPSAWLFLIALSLLGLVVLLQLPVFAALVAVASLLLVAAYPFMKRITWWPQAWLGLTFNWGILVGWATIAGALPPAALVLYAAGVCWTLGYDTIYALQDVEDDALIGIRSSALRLGRRVVAGVAGFYAAAFVLMASAVLLAVPGRPAAIAPLLPVALHFAWQVRTLGRDHGAALRLFRSNAGAGALTFAALVAARYLP